MKYLFCFQNPSGLFRKCVFGGHMEGENPLPVSYTHLTLPTIA